MWFKRETDRCVLWKEDKVWNTAFLNILLTILQWPVLFWAKEIKDQQNFPGSLRLIGLNILKAITGNKGVKKLQRALSSVKAIAKEMFLQCNSNVWHCCDIGFDSYAHEC
jgi:hypothetical protein